MFRIHRPQPEDCGTCEDRIQANKTKHTRWMIPAIAALAMGSWGFATEFMDRTIFHIVSFVLMGGGLGWIWEMTRESRDYERENKIAMEEKMKHINEQIQRNEQLILQNNKKLGGWGAL